MEIVTQLLNSTEGLPENDKRSDVEKKIEQIRHHDHVLLLRYINFKFKSVTLDQENVIIYNLADMTDTEIDILDDKLNIILKDK